MPECSNHNCNSQPIFLEKYCWKHLSDQDRKEYPHKLLAEMEKRRVVEEENFEGVHIEDVTFPDYVGFRKCNFRYAFIHECSFQHADFRGINTKLRFADARESHFEGALLQNTDLTGADLRDAIFIDADMIGASSALYP